MAYLHLSSEDRMFENGWYNVIYVCAKCGAKDTDRRMLSDASPIAPAANCWKCGAGRGLDPGDMMANRKGMFPQPVNVPAQMPA